MQSSVYKANLTQVWLSTKEGRDISLYVNGSSVTQCQARTVSLAERQAACIWAQHHADYIWMTSHFASRQREFTSSPSRGRTGCTDLERLTAHTHVLAPFVYFVMIFSSLPCIEKASYTHSTQTALWHPWLPEHTCTKCTSCISAISNKFLPLLSITSSAFTFTHIKLSSCASVCSFSTSFVSSWNNRPSLRPALCMLLIFLLNQTKF